MAAVSIRSALSSSFGSDHGPRNGCELSRERVASLVSLVRKIALSFARRLPPHVCVDDLVSAGQLGLVEAMQRYEPSMCDRFEAFAAHRIKGAMLDAIRGTDPLSRHQRSNARRLDVVGAGLRARLGRDPSDLELADAMGMTLDTLRDLVAAMAYRGEVSIADETGIGAVLRAVDGDPEEGASHRQLVGRLASAITSLPERMQTLLGLYYCEGLTLSEIGAVMHITESRACQIHREARQILREQMAVS